MKCRICGEENITDTMNVMYEHIKKHPKEYDEVWNLLRDSFNYND